MDGVPQNGSGHTQHQQQNLGSPFDSSLHHHLPQHQHPYYQQQQQYNPAPYAQQQQHYYQQHHHHQPQQNHVDQAQAPTTHHHQPQQNHVDQAQAPTTHHHQPQQNHVDQGQAPTTPHQQYYSNHQAAWGNANNLQAYAYYNQQPQQTYHHHQHQQPIQQPAPPHQHRQQEESLANLSRFVNQPPVSTPHPVGMSMSQQQRGPISSGNGGRPGPGSSPASSSTQLMPVRLQNVKGPRTKAGMRKLIQEQSVTPAPVQASSSSPSPAKKKKLGKDSYDEAIEAIVEASSEHASPTSDLQPEKSKKKMKKSKVKPKKRSEPELSQPPIVLNVKKASLRRDSEVDAAQLLLDFKESPPAKIEPKMLRRSLSHDKKTSPALVVESKKKLKLELQEHEHPIIRKEMIPVSTPGPSSPVESLRPKTKVKKAKVSTRLPSSSPSEPEYLTPFLNSFDDTNDSESDSPVAKRARKSRQNSGSPVQFKVVTPSTPPKAKRERTPKSYTTPKLAETLIKNESPEIEILEVITKTQPSRSRSKTVSSNAFSSPARKPKGRPKGSKTKNRRVVPAVKKDNSNEVVTDSVSAHPVPTTAITRPKSAVGLLDKRALFKGPRVPTVTRVESSSSSVKKTPHVPIVGPSIRVKHGKVKFYRGSDEEDVDEQLKKPLPAREPKGKTAKIETDNKDGPWICVFCKAGPHAVQLGDLFGPYFVQSTQHGIPHRRETWVHSDCVLWAGNVFLVGDTLRNLDSAVGDADKILCKICTKAGATIGCLKRGCSQTSHYPCAMLNGWNLNENTYHSYCRSHADMGSCIHPVSKTGMPS